MKKFFVVSLLISIHSAFAQSLYFPPLSGNSWDTIQPASLGWCSSRIDSLFNFLESRNSKGFIILKNGKIVLEKYFGTFTQDSVHYWASAGKSLTAFLTGIAQEKGLLNINNPVSGYIGTGWTNAPPAKENLITIRNLLEMTSGLDDNPSPPCTNEDSSRNCLNYLSDAGTRWAYHTAAYKHLQQTVSAVSGQSYSLFTYLNVGAHIGMPGLWLDGVFYSTPRSMARFGLLNLGRGIWNNDTVLHDQNYFNAMTNTSQNFNQSYGYLWWLNGKTSFMLPALQIVFPGSLLPNAPPDLFAALGKNDQKIYVAPSQSLVVVRVGDAAYSSQFAITVFDNELWNYIDSLSFCPTPVHEIQESVNSSFSLFPNPINSNSIIRFNNPGQARFSISIFDCSGRIIATMETTSGHFRVGNLNFSPGIYFIRIENSQTGKTMNGKFICL